MELILTVGHNSATPAFIAAFKGHYSCLKYLLDKGADAEIRTDQNVTAIFIAAEQGFIDCIQALLNINVDTDIRRSDNVSVIQIVAERDQSNLVLRFLFDKGCVIHPEDTEMIQNDEIKTMILDEVDDRHKRKIFDSFINHHIEYQPYIKNIFTLCYPTGNIQVAKPSVGWIRAEIIRDKYYFDEIFFYLHMHIANYTNTNKRTNTIIITKSMLHSSSYFSKNSDKTSTLMTVLTDRLKLLLKPE